MSGRGRYRNNRSRNQPTSSFARENAYSISADSPILAVFLQTARKLTDRHDRHERMVKLSRDITIESKRIIFLLHAAVTREQSREEINAEARQRIQTLINSPIKAIALELENAPRYLHSRAITAGLQEFIEARTLLSLMENKEMISLPEVQNEFQYTVISEDGHDRQISTLLPYLDYMLGLADLTGELMRKAINSIASGDHEDCVFACQVVRQLYAGFLGICGAGPQISAKLNVTRANVYKVEYAAYALKVRGGEAPPKLLLPLPPAPTAAWEQPVGDYDGDEGFY